MQSSSIFTRQRMGLDNNVWIILLSCIVLSIGLLGYNVINKGKEKPCLTTIDIFINGRLNTDSIYFKAGEPIAFRSSLSSVDHIVWNFGDETKKEGFSALHTYGHEGRFTITATINDKCWYSKKINIETKSTAITDTAGNILENIIGQERPTLGEKVIYSTTLLASSYEWFLQNINASPKTGKEVSFKFTRQQSYTLVLRLDHDNKRRFTKIINVSNPGGSDVGAIGPVKPLILPEIRVKKDSQATDSRKDTTKIPPAEPVKKYKYVSDEILKTYIQSVVCKEMTPEQFNDYLCKGVATPVIINDKERKTFSQLCSEIQAKKIKIESVKTTRDPENCVINIIVNYDRKWLLGRNPCRN